MPLWELLFTLTAPSSGTTNFDVTCQEMITMGDSSEDPLEKVQEAQKWKEEGNNHYKLERFEEAVEAYSKAIGACPKGQSDRAVYYKNRSACYLKLQKYEKAAQDAAAALDIIPNDTKALFRKCQALEQLGRFEEAFKEALQLNKLEPSNTAVQAMLRRLNAIVAEKVTKLSTTDSKVVQMFTALSDEDVEKRRQAANNLIVLARETTGAERIFAEGGVSKIQHLLQGEDKELTLAGLRVLSCLCQGHKARANAVLKEFTLPSLAKLISSPTEEIANAAANILLTAIQAMIEEDSKQPRKAKEALVPDLTTEFKSLLMFLLGLLTDKNVSGYGRDAVIDIIMKFVPKETGTGRALTFMTNGGLMKLLTVAGQVPELKRLPITANTRMHAAVALSKLYDEMHSEKNRKYYDELCNKFITDKFNVNTMESNMEAITAITALLQGPFDVGNGLIGREGVVEVMVAMAGSYDVLHQKVALEAIIQAANKKDRCTGILQTGINILKECYKSSNDNIKVRALVGMCKLGVAGGTDASIKLFADGATVKLAKEVKRFLLNPEKIHDLQKWAAEGLSFLSLDGDVKEDIVNDPKALKTLIELAKSGDKTVLYSVASVFVNLSNSYDEEKPDPEMVKLAQFAKQHIPEPHPKDSKEYLQERVRKLLREGVVTALVFLAKADSENCREQVARVFLTLTEGKDDRGLIVQQGGGKALIPLANNGTMEGKVRAAQALARIGITMNPELAFPGQRCLEIVRPLVSLLHVDRTGLQNFEALMALTNLAGISDSLRNRILKEKGFSQIENYMFEDHDMIKRAATECMCNLVSSEEVAQKFLGDNDRVKLLVLYCGEEDEALVKAAAGALASIAHLQEVCDKVLKVKAWLEIMQGLCASENIDIRMRGVHVVMSLIESSKENATTVVETNLLEIMMAFAKDETPAMKGVRSRAESALQQATEWGLIKPT
ncbi:protein unc-45 homolog B-like [Acanthaster planci]|uniref:Protein unc-45 homolog B-like n=1 Tax=Acanthaster planci TaxID=133434 RepID=A0A8B7YB34_ACAPL|nr:protein unc-45 homolog B-like [Acanthaster planci]